MADRLQSSPNDPVGRFLANDVLNATKDTAVVPGGLPNAVDVKVEPFQRAMVIATDGVTKLPLDDNLLDVADLCRMFEESEESSYTARQEAERDRDYVDNKQLTADELAALGKRGQPPQIDNRIKTKIDYLVGLEKQQRIDPKALPRTPQHEQDADGATQALRYVAETEQFDYKRSAMWRNLLVEGTCGISVAVEMDAQGKPQIKLRRWAWDRLFHDPHSNEPDFSDAGYLGGVTWMDYTDALAMYPDGQDALDNTLSSAPSQTYDDKPKWSLWADKKRKRVRICVIWLKRGEEWHFAEFTKGGILKGGPSPYVNDKGESDCEMLFQSAYVDRDGNRYALVREMITLQDGINKRHSKALHLLNSKQLMLDEDALPTGGVEKLRKEMHRPDGTLVFNPGSMANGKVKIETNLELAAAQLGLLQEAKNSIDLKGPNATQMGDKTQGSSAASGRAIIASQQGGMIALGDLLDNLRHLDRRVFRAIWARIRQFWTEETWIRITDDERQIKWVGMNLDPMKMQQVQMQAQQNPQIAQKIGGMMGSVAELDCDIIIDEVPDVIASQEQFGMLVELKKMDANGELPFRALVAASQIKDKSKMLEEMDKVKQPGPEQQEAAQIQKAGAIAQVEETKSKAALNMARAQEAGQPEMGAPQQPPDFEIPPELQVAKAAADINLVQANTEKARVEAMLAPLRASHDAMMKQKALQQRQQQMNRPQSAA